MPAGISEDYQPCREGYLYAESYFVLVHHLPQEAEKALQMNA
jgi:hypothetical protein